MKRRGYNTQSWKTRMSAGGANRTNLQGAMARLHELEDSLLIQSDSHRHSGSDLIPKRRVNSFKPFNSRLQPSYYRSPIRSYRDLEPAPPPPISSFLPPRHTRRERSPDVLVNDKGHPIPRKGMFLNAKYSEAVPLLDECQVQRTAGLIRRMVDKSHRSKQFSLPDYQLQDSIRQAVYRQGVPDLYRTREPQYEEYGDEVEPGPSRQRSHHSSHHQSYHPSHQDLRRPRLPNHYRGDRRAQFEEEEEYDSDDEDEVFRETARQPPQKNKRRVVDEFEEHSDHPSRKTQRKRNVEEREERSSNEDEHDKSNHSNASNASKTSKTSKSKNTSRIEEERAPSRGSKSSKHSTPKLPSPTAAGPYIKDSDNDDNWRKSLPFMCQPDGPGAAMLERVGSAITPLSLRDDSKNSYSEVALMLLGKSLNNLRKPEKERREARPQSELLNMSTNWSRHQHKSRSTRNSDGVEKVVLETRKSDTLLMREISRIQNPQNATTFQFEPSSVFAQPRLFDMSSEVRREKSPERIRHKKKMPPPLYRSSPISQEVSKSHDAITVPSSIKKGPERYGFVISDDEEEPVVTRQQDIDDYIARGASQLDGSYFPLNSNSCKSSENPLPVQANPQPTSRDEMNIEPSSKISESSDTRREYEIDTSSFKSKSKEASSVEFTSRFMFSQSQKKKKKTVRHTGPMMEMDEESQKMFEDAFESNGGPSDREKYLF